MIIAMSRPWRHPDTGVFYFRSRLPADLVKIVAGQKVTVEVSGQPSAIKLVPIFKVSLRTKEPGEARLRHASVQAQLQERWAAARKGAVSLSHRDIHALVCGRLGMELGGRVMTSWKAYRVIPDKGVESSVSASLKVKQRSITFHDIKPIDVPRNWLQPLRNLLTSKERKEKRAFEILLAHLAHSALANYQDGASATIAHHKLVFKPYEAHLLSVEQGAERKAIDIDRVALEGYLKVGKGHEATALLTLGVDPEVVGGIEDDDHPRRRGRLEYFVPQCRPPHALEVLDRLIEKGVAQPSALKRRNALKDLKALKLVVSERGSDQVRLVDVRMTNADYLLRQAVAKADCIEIARTVLKLNPLASGMEIAAAVSHDLNLDWNRKGTLRRHGNSILRWMLWLEPYVVDATTSNKAGLIAYAVDNNEVGSRGGRRDGYRKAMEKELRRLVAEGKALAEIAEKFGVSIGTVIGWKRHYNLSRGRPRK